MRLVFLLVGTAGLFPATVHAQTAAPAQAAEAPSRPADISAGTSQPPEAAASAGKSPSDRDYHRKDDNEVVVTAFRRNREDLLSGTTVVSGDTLARELRPTIGDTLARQPGVSATSFGPNASRPVLRGMQGERVRVLTDGIGSLDASNTSVDHAVAINPLTAERVEVLRGPSALLYGSSAIGGVVNVIDSRIPRRIPDEPVHVDGIATYGSAARERSISGAADAPIGAHFVAHVDASYSKSSDLRTGGFILGPRLRAEAQASADPEIRALARLRDRLPNSAARTWDVAAGAAYVNGDTNIGLSASHYDSLYGVPIRYALDPAAEAEAPRIHIKQNRLDGRAEIAAGSGFIESIRLRAGYSDYRHDELEEDGSVGTTFLSKGFEARAEAVQAKRGGWSGGFGAQYFHRGFDVIGDEKFLPKNRASQFGLFALQALDLGALKLEAGARYEHSQAKADADADLGNPALQRRFDAISASVGGSYTIGDGIRVGLNLSHSERAPSAEELFANGPHAGTQAFEIGDPNLQVEKNLGMEASLHVSGDGYHLDASVYRSRFRNFIYEARTGEIEDDLPVFRIRQTGARQWGFELEGSIRVAKIGATTISLDALADYTRTTIRGVGPAPRIPPFRLLGGMEAKTDRIQGRIEVEWVDDQHRLADFETATRGYTMVNASLSFQPFEANSNTTIMLSVNNLFDVDARRHASSLKDFAPLAGRDIRISARLNL